MKKFIFLAALLCTATLISGKDKINMRSYLQPYSNYQLNSFVGNSTKARGELFVRFRHSEDYLLDINYLRGLFVLDEKYLVIDVGWGAKLLDIKKKEICFQKKTNGNFLIFRENDFYLFNGSFFTIRNALNFCKEIPYDLSVGNFYDNVDMEFFYPFQNGFITGSNYPPTQRGDPPYLKIEKHTLPNQKNFDFKFSEPHAAQLPLTKEGNIIAGLENKILLITQDGKKQTLLEGKFMPLTLSIGYDNIIYLVNQEGDSTLLYALNTGGKVLWKHKTQYYSQPYVKHPPVVSLESIVYLVGDKKLEAYSSAGCLWEYPLDNVQSSQLAVVLEDETLLVCTGNRILHIDEFGKLLWAYKDQGNLPFLTQPVLDYEGRVLAATIQDIVVLK